MWFHSSLPRAPLLPSAWGGCRGNPEIQIHEEEEEKMFFKAVPSFALQSYFEALPILAPCIVCFFLFPSTDRSRCTHRGTHACTCIVQRKTCTNMPSMLTSSCPTSVPTLFFSLAFSPHPWDHYSLSSLFFPSLAHSSPSSLYLSQEIWAPLASTVFRLSSGRSSGSRGKELGSISSRVATAFTSRVGERDGTIT